MRSLRQRLVRHLSFANLIAATALFVALGGVGYAATTINGNAIKKQTIGAGKLKKKTLTSAQVKENALTGSVIDESTLTIVPQAQAAVSAQSASNATNAQTAKTAATATTAQTAATAESATTAANADNADAVDGFTAEELQLSCAAGTSLYGGVCWDDTVRPAKFWIGAAVECGEAGGRLPTLSELLAYVLRPGEQVSAPTWSGDVAEVGAGNKEVVLIRSETTTATSEADPGIELGYRCVFYPSNS